MKKMFMALVVFTCMAGVAHAGEAALKVSVSSMLSPKETYSEYKKIVDYLGKKLGRKAELVQNGSYEQTNRLLKDSAVDIAFICSGPYVDARDGSGVEILAAPVTKESYRSLIIVKAGSPYKGIKDLKGRTFAYTDPDSNTGCWVPKYMLFKQGIDPEKFFGRTIYTHSHDNSVEAVAKGLADGAGVDSIIYHYMVVKGYPAMKDIKVIDQSEAFAMPPVVVPKGTDPKLKAAARKALLEMDKDPEGKGILGGLLIEKFSVPSDADYASVRKVRDYIKKHGKEKR